MYKKTIINNYLAKDFPQEIIERISRSRSKNRNRSYVSYEKVSVGKTKNVDMLTFFNIPEDKDDADIIRYFVSVDDFKILFSDGFITGTTYYDYRRDQKYTNILNTLEKSYCIMDDGAKEYFKRVSKQFCTKFDDIFLALRRLERYTDYNKENNRRRKRAEKIRNERIEDFKLFRNKKIPKYVENSSKNAPTYFFEENNNLYCTHCKKDYPLIKLDKHKTERQCPGCKKKGTVQRVSQCKNTFSWHQYTIVPRIKGDKVAVSIYLYTEYIHKSDYRNKKMYSKESNRVIMDTKSTSIHYYHNWGKNCSTFERCTATTGNFNERSGMYGWSINEYCCRRGILRNKNVIKNAPGYDYYIQEAKNVENLMKSNKEWYCLNTIINLYYHHEGENIEKFKKLDMFKLYDNIKYWKDIKFSEKEPHKILKISKEMFKYMRESKRDVYTLYKLQRINRSKIPFDASFYELLASNNLSDNYMALYSKRRLANYLIKNKIPLYSYETYLKHLELLEYPKNKLYLYPKNFNKMDKVLREEYDEKIRVLEEEKRKATISKQLKTLSYDETLQDPNDERNIKMHKIINGLMQMKGIKKFMEGSNGLLVKVPENVFEIKQEGIRLANCIGRLYSDQIINGDTFIFFIRRVSDPEDSYFAMEYKEGKIQQIHGYANCNANNEITEFCNKFGSFLSKKHFNPKKLLAAA